MNNCYYELAKKSTISKDLLELAFNTSGWTPYFKNHSPNPKQIHTYEQYYKLVPASILVKDDLFKWLFDTYEFTAAIMRIDPYSCYNWHKDSRRGAGINMALNPNVRSFCVFANDINEFSFPIKELAYKPNTYYLFNTQQNHTVYNFEQTRYMFTVKFKKNKDEFSYEDLLNAARIY